jgi:hypothetical protein
VTTIFTLLEQGSLWHRWRLALPLAARAMFRLPVQWRADAAPREAAEEAAAVRALAHRHRNSDPGFSSDLYAAVDRFERERCEPV